MASLTDSQLRALSKVTADWQSAKTLEETLPTLDSLEKLKLVEKRLDFTSDKSARDITYYRRKAG